jgi:predicted lipid-binding transport protein (Tim44 family)
MIKLRSSQLWSRFSLTSVTRALGNRPALVAGVAVLLALLLVATLAFARPGGGQGYSGPSSSPSGGSGGGDDGLLMIFFLLLQLCFEHPVIGIPLMIIFLVVVGVSALLKARRSSYGDWESGVSPSPARPAQQPVPMQAIAARQHAPLTPSSALQAIRRFDPNFSTVLFEDFLYSLFAEVHRARGGNRLDRLSAYLAPTAMASLAQRPVAEVHGVIVGAMRIVHVSGVGPSDAYVQVGVEFEANYTERTQPQGALQGLYVMEQWHLTRKHGPLSRTPAQVNVLACPSCGAPLDVVTAGRCSHCGQQVNSGAFDWTVQGIQLVHRETRGPMLTSNVPEQGTNLPTVFDPQVHQASAALAARDPQFRWDTFQARLGLIFTEFQTAWSARNLAAMRPFLSDALFQTQAYWVEAYKQQRLRNVTERTRITGLEIAKVGSDRFYDAITVRLRATGLDYTVAEDGNRIVSGSNSRERAYTEYWTLIRGSGRSAPTRTDKACSNCGAPLQVNMAGYCEYCKAKVTSGEFDWVLSKIEQDEAYRG